MCPSSATADNRRRLGNSDLWVSPIALGTWPMAGVTSLDVNESDSVATLRSCIDLGINFVDTAYCYGPQGESENLIRQALSECRDEIILATKCGIHYNSHGSQTQDAHPDTIRQECNHSLERLGTDRIELYYLHSPDPQVPIEESAGAISELIAKGKVRYAGASNCQLGQLQVFHQACPLTAVQLPYNMLQRDIEQQSIPWCQEQNISLIVYWALMKGLLAGRMSADKPLAPLDARAKYPMYQGEEWQRNLQFVDQLQEIADSSGHTVAQLVANWTIHQPGITVALCGAKRPWQIKETARAMNWQLTPAQRGEIDKALASRGKAQGSRVFS